MKGISGMIAAILLVAFTIGVGGILSLWFTTLTQTQTAAAEAIAENRTRCAVVYIDIYRVDSSRIYYLNPSTQTITDITFYVDGTTITPTTTSLAPGAAASQTWTRGTNTSVKATGLCLASIPVEGNCRQGQPCWQ